VVIAEDEAIVRMDLEEILTEEGYQVVGSTGRGDEVVDLVRASQADLVVLDIKMPGLDGLSVARTLAEEHLAAALILTAFSQRSLVEQARQAGVMAYLVKPFQRDELVPAVEVALGRFQEMRALERELATQTELAANLEAQLEVRRLIDRAKGRLMDDHHLSEQESFRFIQRTAMDRRTNMATVATLILEGQLSPGEAPA
jgi:response regulator NasT